jgi:hypothetical protein
VTSGPIEDRDPIAPGAWPSGPVACQAPPDHLARLHGERWAVWRWVALRGAGFPVDPVLALADPVLAETADRTLEDGAGTAFTPAFAAARRRAGARIQQVAAEPLFREAIAWQNREALHTAVDRLLHRADPPARRRRQEQLVVRYLQRYCTKNDTIGFFGPAGWARVSDDAPAIDLRPGPGLLVERRTYFEGWCIELLAAALAAGGELQPWLAPRLLPHLHVEGSHLVVPLGRGTALTRVEVAVLRACDGRRTAREIAAELAADPMLGLDGEGSVLDVLRRLRDGRRVAWTLEVPGDDLHPERRLRALLERVGDDGLRSAALGALDELEAARAAVAAAAGSAERLDVALGGLGATFARLTGAAQSRGHGEEYAGRALVYEDCRRDVEVRLGPELLAELGPALSLVLDAARWLVAEAAALYREAIRTLHAELGGGVVPLASLWLHAHDLLFGDASHESEVVREVAGRLHRRWAAVLLLPPGARRVARRAAELRPRVDAAFAVDGRAWDAAIYHSPDVMLAAADVGAVRRGDFVYVLGEVHPAINTLRTALFPESHPAPGELLRAAEGDLPGPQVVPVYGRGRGLALRTSRGLVPPRDHRLVFAVDTCGVPPERALPIGSLVVEDAGDSLTVRTRDGRLRFDVMDALGELLALRLAHTFDVAPPAPHTPRVTIDRLVVSREAWRLPAAGVAFASARDEAARFLEARRWRRGHRMPRLVFARTRPGTKPFFVDFDSPLSVEVLARTVRQAAATAPEEVVTVTEMLPTPDQMWLTDADGRRCASELRFVAVDRS